ncbi:pantetheine-phosphate adenylyltransferase [Cyanobacterium sp. Dongsha4]|uniref:pantetheine-phosphate adenylyltransferase n=1 Tax=Cyanobacterium sp. DS4 TaxID=2878255 RepID=UPI002E817E2D|nr:pantetheine-phosphate adenylyltransferase [Cyanobacterium sp. Dongsha4]WVK99527.1 pantetheine-phosphate adenylyltransferase [Cyanobacterium sp. Dongsha4]
MIAIYPGSFDPITLGHLDLIKRSSILFEKVIVAVLKNPNKKPLFSIEKRVQQITQCVNNIPNIEVDSFTGLTVEYAKKKKAGVLLRGLRVMSDFEQELQMAHINKTLENSLETVFLATNTELSFISSSVVKEIAKLGGEIEHLVPPTIAEDLRIYLSK